MRPRIVPRMASRVGRALVGAFCILCAIQAPASQRIADKYVESTLYDRPVEVVPGVWSAIGATAPPTYENSGHNNNLSFVITTDGVLVVNGGASYLLAKALHDEIRKITKQPVKMLVSENGQGHAMLGNNYWAEQGVPVVMHVDAAHEITERGEDILARMLEYNRDKGEGTKLVQPSETVDARKEIKMGDTRIVLISFGAAHSPGDMSVWLPDKDLIITGDMAFHERLLPIFEDTVTADWLESWEKFAALNATHVIPGHGRATNMAEVTKYTKDYLLYLRGQVRTLLDADGELKDSYAIDQSAYAHLDTFNELSKRNAERVFREMEFE